MSKKTGYLLGILLTILIGTYFYWRICCYEALSLEEGKSKVVHDGTDKDGDTSTPKAKATSYPFTLNDPDGDFSFSSTENFNFEVSGFNFKRPVPNDVNLGIAELQLYLGGNENKSVDISGMYTSEEVNTSAFPDLGMARANSVKNYLITEGIPSSQMNLFGKLNRELVPDGTILLGPVEFGISTIVDTSAVSKTAVLDTLRKKIQEKPLILNFATAQTSIDLNEAQRQKIADIVRYIDLSETGKVMITGHADATGSRKGNVSLGQGRADFAKRYLVQNGISELKIEALSKGSDEPIGNNATEAGRALNRRTVVTVN